MWPAKNVLSIFHLSRVAIDQWDRSNRSLDKSVKQVNGFLDIRLKKERQLSPFSVYP